MILDAVEIEKEQEYIESDETCNIIDANCINVATRIVDLTREFHGSLSQFNPVDFTKAAMIHKFDGLLLKLTGLYNGVLVEAKSRKINSVEDFELDHNKLNFLYSVNNYAVVNADTYEVKYHYIIRYGSIPRE
jgi:hypothetical protein